MYSTKTALEEIRDTFRALAAEAESNEADARGARNYAEAGRCQIAGAIWSDAASEVDGTLLEIAKKAVPK